MSGSVLVVDDDPRVRDAICAQLRRRGLRASGAGDADAGLERLVAEPVDLLITDVCLPGRSGLWLLAEVRRRWADRLPVVLITGWYPDRDQLEHYRAADAVLLKPVRMDALLTRVARLLVNREESDRQGSAARGDRAAMD